MSSSDPQSTLTSTPTSPIIFILVTILLPVVVLRLVYPDKLHASDPSDAQNRAQASLAGHPKFAEDRYLGCVRDVEVGREPLPGDVSCGEEVQTDGG
jgi:hypothetical protein